MTDASNPDMSEAVQVLGTVEAGIQTAELENAEMTVRRLTAYKWRLSGASFPEIAEKLQVSLGTAHGYVQWCYANLPAAIEGAQTLRRLSLERLEGLYYQLNDARDNGDMDAIRLSISIINTQADIMGLKKINVDANTTVTYKVEGVDTEALT